MWFFFFVSVQFVFTTWAPYRNGFWWENWNNRVRNSPIVTSWHNYGGFFTLIPEKLTTKKKKFRIIHSFVKKKVNHSVVSVSQWMLKISLLPFYDSVWLSWWICWKHNCQISHNETIYNLGPSTLFIDESVIDATPQLASFARPTVQKTPNSLFTVRDDERKAEKFWDLRSWKPQIIEWKKKSIYRRWIVTETEFSAVRNRFWWCSPQCSLGVVVLLATTFFWPSAAMIKTDWASHPSSFNGQTEAAVRPSPTSTSSISPPTSPPWHHHHCPLRWCFWGIRPSGSDPLHSAARTGLSLFHRQNCKNTRPLKSYKPRRACRVNSPQRKCVSRCFLEWSIRNDY